MDQKNPRKKSIPKSTTFFLGFKQVIYAPRAAVVWALVEYSCNNPSFMFENEIKVAYFEDGIIPTLD